MTKSKKKIVWLSVTLTFGLILVWYSIPLLARAFGISPPHVINDRLSPGSYYEQRITLSRTNPEQELNCEVELNTPGFENWLTISPGKIFPFPSGEKVTKMFVKVQTPKDAKPGRYRGSIRVRVVPTEKEKGITIALGARIDVDLTVTSEKFQEFQVRLVQIPDLEKDWTIEVKMKIENKGNVKVAPSKVSLAIYDSGYKKLLSTVETKKIPPVKPFEIQEVSAFLKPGIKLEVGQYWGEVKVYRDGEVVWQEKAIFTVKPKGSLPPRPSRILSEVSIWVWIIIGIIVLAVFSFFIFKIVSKKRKK